ncbi:CCR4-NOT transcription complex [Aulographum hederae CBS 113979]|uniref:General negative regulator of transcription subunit n=1 Tax=Aulographum hederae CBS 113979 TaxID=1176131 RepID=A0A6G1H2W2_9PEZI|nr:CCR4-NOT transcription complex [Aulographum hederae CBS 113979]
MAARKLANELDKCFKKVKEGVEAFQGIYDKIQTCTNPSQKEKLEDSLKKEIKKLQRSRDQIKTWAQSNDIKDKKPLLDHRKLIETQMELFKAVEKEMKTKAFSKEGLSAQAKLDPKERERADVISFLGNMLEEIALQIETTEANAEALQATVKKGKKDTAKADRIAELERVTERHKWHQNKLELILRAMENGSVEADQVKELEEGIKYYVEQNQEVDFMEDDTMYDDLNLQDEEELFGMGNDNDHTSSQDAQSVQEEPPDSVAVAAPTGKPKSGSISETNPAARRPSAQLKSPLPALATLNTPLPSVTNGVAANNMKPAPIPNRAPGEPLKYASAAAAAAASDKNGIGIAPLPRVPKESASEANTGLSPMTAAAAPKASSVTSPAPTHATPSVPKPAVPTEVSSLSIKSPTLSQASVAMASTESSSIPPTPALDTSNMQKPGEKGSQAERSPDDVQPATPALTNGDTHSEIEEESIYHLPSSLQDLLESFEATRNEANDESRKLDERMLAASHATAPDAVDAERPRHYKPAHPYPYTPPHYPQEPLAIFDDPRLYSRVDTDTLFYAFYYRQGTYQQYLAAKALKSQSWRFHKQYQTWFQRHEEPKSITEDYEQGTYRFFDYESTWMNRRKGDFRFHYKYLEDDL